MFKSPMSATRYLLIFLFAGWYFLSCSSELKEHRQTYYVSSEGNDQNSGLTFDQAWRTIDRVNAHVFSAGDSLLFRAGDEYSGKIILDSDDSGTLENRVVISSYGSGKATINGEDGAGCYAEACSFLTLTNLILYGAGRKTGNTSDGILLMNVKGAELTNLEVYGFQHSGIHVHKCQDISITHIHAHDNGFAGIHVSGSSIWDKRSYDNTEIYIAHCVAENNPGDPTVLDNHSGNGILASSVRKGTIEYCEAFDNGWDMPWTGNGPVGIWIWDCTDFTIQHCISHHNRTNPSAKDGGGFDLDGGVSNSVIQYCISFSNEGIGYGLFEFGAAKPWENNIVRYCLSYNDGILNDGSLGIWKNEEAGTLANCQIYNNTFYNSQPGKGNLWLYDNYPGIQFRNNVFIYNGSFLSDAKAIKDEVFEGNCYWDLNGDPSFLGFESLEVWAQSTGKEMNGGEFTGHFADPLLSEFIWDPGIDPADLSPETFKGLSPLYGSPLIDKGLDLTQMLKIDVGKRDLLGTEIPSGNNYDIGAIELNISSQ